MKLQAAEFIPTQYELSRFPVISSSTSDIPTFQDLWPPSIALQRVSMDDLTERCRLYITNMVRQQGALSELLPGRINKVSKRVLDAASLYYKSIYPSPKVC